MWEALAAGAPIRPFMLMGNAEYLVLPGRPIRIVRGETLPRYWFADQIVPIRSREEFVRNMSRRWSDRTIFMESASPASRGEILTVQESSHRTKLKVHADRSALLFASVTPHRYWRVTIDGTRARLMTANIGFQAVIVPAGMHTIRLDYFNPLLAVSAIISIISFLIVITIMIYHNR